MKCLREMPCLAEDTTPNISKQDLYRTFLADGPCTTLAVRPQQYTGATQAHNPKAAKTSCPNLSNSCLSRAGRSQS